MAETVFPEPDFADQRHRFAFANVKRDAIDHAREICVFAKGDGEIAHVDQGNGVAISFYP